MIYYKDCYNYCNGDGCNQNNDVESEFTRLDKFGNSIELTCYDFTMSYDVMEHENITNNLDGLENLNNRQRKCPNYANWGCFTGNFTSREIQDDLGENLRPQINKGCSMFDLGHEV